MNPNLGLKLNGYIKASYAGNDTQAANDRIHQPKTEGSKTLIDKKSILANNLHT